VRASRAPGALLRELGIKPREGKQHPGGSNTGLPKIIMLPKEDLARASGTASGTRSDTGYVGGREKQEPEGQGGRRKKKGAFAARAARQLLYCRTYEEQVTPQTGARSQRGGKNLGGSPKKASTRLCHTLFWFISGREKRAKGKKSITGFKRLHDGKEWSKIDSAQSSNPVKV